MSGAQKLLRICCTPISGGLVVPCNLLRALPKIAMCRFVAFYVWEVVSYTWVP